MADDQYRFPPVMGTLLLLSVTMLIATAIALSVLGFAGMTPSAEPTDTPDCTTTPTTMTETETTDAQQHRDVIKRNCTTCGQLFYAVSGADREHCWADQCDS